jgi:formylglycine-generating enzyme required for sulfatase activity
MYYIDKFEVSNAQYSRCVLDGRCQKPLKNGSKTRSSYYDNAQHADYPVVYVSWQNAFDFCSWRGGRLPSEAEWEKAARSDKGFSYPWGFDLPDCQHANYWPMEACAGDTVPVIDLPQGRSPYGVLNLSGNVLEWVVDWFQSYPGGYLKASKVYGTTHRVVRGGAYFDGPNHIQATSRKGMIPDEQLSYVGFRCVVDIDALP